MARLLRRRAAEGADRRGRCAKAVPEPRRTRARWQRSRPMPRWACPGALDMWDGYPADRERFYACVQKAGANAHRGVRRQPRLLGQRALRRSRRPAGGLRVRRRRRSPAPAPARSRRACRSARPDRQGQPEVLFNDQAAKGFVLLTLTRDGRRAADMVAVSTINAKEFRPASLKSFVTSTPEGAGAVRRSRRSSAAPAPAARRSPGRRRR